MMTLNVDLGDRAYPIHIGAGLIGRTELFAPHIHGSSVTIVTNTTVDPLYGDVLRAALAPLGKRVSTVVLPDGEAHKNWETLNLIFDGLLTERADRKTTLVALGGGVIGDMTGFAAACYMRGVPFIQVPTTLLSQVDSSVGGKTGINHPLGKNMIGAFYQPCAVISDTATLDTLPEREYVAGIAEIIKYGAVCDVALFEWLEANMGRLLARDPDAVAQAVIESCRIKSGIVASDERESGPRTLLNFGHTFGHAIEAATAYEVWLHGEAVAAGMIIAAALSERVAGLPPDHAARIRALIYRVPGLRREPPMLQPSQWLELISRDKKARDRTPQFVLLTAIGTGVVRADVGRADIDLALVSAASTARRA